MTSRLADGWLLTLAEQEPEPPATVAPKTAATPLGEITGALAGTP
jgi:hypothetical protein